MEPDRLRNLLLRSEYGTLEFKREWYKLNSPNPETKKRERAELVKDILSLANGNSIVTGAEAHLVIGADNQIGPKGVRELYDVDPQAIAPLTIRDIINRVCDPPLEEVYCDTVFLDGKRLVVVTIPPTPHVYETTCKLEAVGRSFDEYTVFVRHSEGVVPASTREREILARIKRLSYRALHGAPPIAFGSVVGALTGGSIAISIAGEKLVATKKTWPLAGIVGALGGALMGAVSGYIYRSTQEIRSIWFRRPVWVRVLATSGGIVGAVVVMNAWTRMRNGLRNRLRQYRAKHSGNDTEK